MNAFNSLYRLNDIIGSAKTHCIFLTGLASPGYRAKMLPIVFADFEYACKIPAYGLISASTINRIHYIRQSVAAFLHGRELCGEEGKGWYGIGTYEKGAEDRWHCVSILFDESSCEPLLVKGHDAALQRVAAGPYDKSRARRNENAIIEHGLMEAPVLNAILGALMRAEPKTAPATIGIRAQRVQLLLEDEEGGRPLYVPETGFACRDEAAGMIIDQIVYAIDDAQRTHRPGPKREHVLELTPE